MGSWCRICAVLNELLFFSLLLTQDSYFVWQICALKCDFRLKSFGIALRCTHIILSNASTGTHSCIKVLLRHSLTFEWISKRDSGVHLIGFHEKMWRMFRVDRHIFGRIGKHKAHTFQMAEKETFKIKLSKSISSVNWLCMATFSFITNFVLNIHLLTCLQCSEYTQKPSIQLTWAGESKNVLTG